MYGEFGRITQAVLDFCWCAVFPRGARKNRTPMIVAYHAAVRPEAPLSRGALWAKGAVEGQAKRRLRTASHNRVK